ncbi:MAG TPA: hypothetical protein ACFYEM_06300 [Candidatus Hypogeohydataceae bacterium YC40]
MKSFFSLILALTMALFLAGPITAADQNNNPGNDDNAPWLNNTGGSITDEVFMADNMLAINGNDNSVNQAISGSGAGGDALNVNLASVVAGQDIDVALNSVQVSGGGSGIGNFNTIVGNITQSGSVNIAVNSQSNN